MTHRLWRLSFVAASIAAVGVALGLTVTSGRSGAAALSPMQARATANRFFRALQAGSYSRACDLFSKDFYRLNVVPDKAHCVLGLRVGMSALGLRYRLTHVSTSAGRATVNALANGAPGRLVLVEEDGRYKVLALEGD